MVRSKLKSKSSLRGTPVEPPGPPESDSSDDFFNEEQVRRPPLKPTWARLRLAILVAILVPLAIFGYFRNRYTTSKLKIDKALVAWDNRQAISEIKRLEKTVGLNAETAFLRSRAYRQMGDDIAFAQFADLAGQLGYSEEKIQYEKTLRDLYLGVIDDVEGAIARVMAAPDANMQEIGPAVVHGLLGKLDFNAVQQFLVFWKEQDPESPWLPYFQGMLLLANRDYPRAMEVLEVCTARHPDFVPAYGQLGMAYLKAREDEKVVPVIRRYLQSNPEELESVAALANALTNLNREDEVLDLLNPLIESGKATVEMKNVLARVYMAREEWGKVVDTLSSVAAIWPEDVRTANVLSQAHQALGNDADAERFAKIAEAGQADIQSLDQRITRLLGGLDATAEKHYELGHILLHKQSREEGLQWLGSALAIDATYLPAHEDLVIYFTRTNQSELAARHQRYINVRRGTQ